MKILPTYTKEKISTEELEKTSERFLQEMFNDELKKKWAQKLQDEHQLERNVGTGRVRLLRWGLSIAAAVLLAIAAWFVLAPASPNQGELLAAYLEDHLGNGGAARQQGSADNELRVGAIEAYQSEDYAQAAVLRQELIDQGGVNIIKDDFFYLGLSYLYQTPPKAQEAITYLERTNEMPGRKFELEGQWSLALAYLLDGRAADARPILERLVAGDSWKAEEAGLLLETLKE